MNTPSGQPPQVGEGSPPSSPPSKSAPLIVGLIAVVALALSAYTWFDRSRGAGSSATINQLEARISIIEKRLDEAGRPAAKSAEPTGAPVGAPANAAAGAAVPVAPVGPPAAPMATAIPAAPAVGVPGAFDILANPDLKGRLGRIVVTFPDGTKVSTARIDTFKSDDANKIRTDYGNAAIELIPGSYDVVINGRKLAAVPVQSRQDTHIHAGVLRLHGAKDTRFDLFEPSGQEKLQTYYGETDVGLPAGEVEILINGQREKVTIENGRITEY